MKKMKLMISVLLLSGIYAGVAFSEEVIDVMEFHAKKGTVHFSHSSHINEFQGDCKRCHEGTPGKIPGFHKGYAHTLCVECHDTAGLPEVESKCDWCHKKQ